MADTIKYLEVRDSCTCIPVIAISTKVEDPIGRKFMWQMGFGPRSNMVFVTKVEPVQTEYNPFAWGENPRTMFRAHKYIQDNWNELKSGDVVDVEYIMGLRATKKEAEIWTTH